MSFESTIYDCLFDAAPIESLVATICELGRYRGDLTHFVLEPSRHLMSGQYPALISALIDNQKNHLRETISSNNDLRNCDVLLMVYANHPDKFAAVEALIQIQANGLLDIDGNCALSRAMHQGYDRAARAIVCSQPIDDVRSLMDSMPHITKITRVFELCERILVEREKASLSSYIEPGQHSRPTFKV